MPDYKNPIGLLSFFDDRTIDKGVGYFLDGRVKFLGWGNRLELLADVSGSKRTPYRTRVQLNSTFDAVRYAVCSCPVASACKHGAALVAYFVDMKQNSPDFMRQVKAAEEKQASAQAEKQANSSPYALSHEVARRISSLAQSRKQKPKQELEKPKLKKNEPNTNLYYILAEDSSTPKPIIKLVYAYADITGVLHQTRAADINQIIQGKNASYILEADREIAKLWRSIANYEDELSRLDWAELDSDPVLFKILMQRILATGRCHLQTLSNPPLVQGAPIDGKLVWNEVSSTNMQLEFVPQEKADNSAFRMIKWTTPWYVNTTTGECGEFQTPFTAEEMEHIITLTVSKNEAPLLQLSLVDSGLDSLIPPPPHSENVKVELIPPQFKLLIGNFHAEGFSLFEGNSITKGEHVKAAVLSIKQQIMKETISTREDGSIIVQRPDLDATRRAFNKLEKYGLFRIQAALLGMANSSDNYFIAPNLQTWLEFAVNGIDALRAEGWEIGDADVASLRPLEIEDDKFFIDIEEKSQWWFSLALDIEIDGKKYPLLPILTTAIHRLSQNLDAPNLGVEHLSHNGKFIAMLPNGNLLCLPFERVRSILESLQEILRRGGLLSDNLEVSALDLNDIIDQSLLDKAIWGAGRDKLLRLFEQLKKLSSLEEVQAPQNFNGTLRPYQLAGLTWLEFLAENKLSGILADDMGLGKTVQLIAHICLAKERGSLDKPFLVLCPTSVRPNWLSELKRFAPHLTVTDFAGSDRARFLSQIASSEIVVTTYPLIARDIDSLKDISFHAIALDEAQAIKNPDTQVSQAVRQLKADYRLSCSGTPMENHLGELWSQFDFLLPGLLGDKKTFKKHIRKPIEDENDLGLRRSLSQRVRPFILRRTKGEVESDLPEKTVIIKGVDLEGAQRDLYETVRLTSTKLVRDEIAKHGFQKSQILILDALLKLRQVCCDPRLVKLASAQKVKQSAKLEALKEMMDELREEGRKTLIFSQFTSMLDLIEQELVADDIPFVTIRGDTKDRSTPVKQFQNSDIPFFLLSLKAAGTGLNLTAADTVIHYDPWWNPAVEDQATDRAHRIGQDKNVFVYKLITQGTIEQRMIELQDRKRALAESIYDKAGGLTPSFSENDLENLLRPISEL